jgi:hypothetical protein
MNQNFSEKGKKFYSENFVLGETLYKISSNHKPNKILVLGFDSIKSLDFLTRWFNQSQIIGYNLKYNNDKIYHEINPRLIVTSNPIEKYDTIIADHSIHHKPDEFLKKGINYLDNKGIIGIIEYDIKNMNINEFHNSWFNTDEGKKEFINDGHYNSYKIHTSHGLEDYMKIMQNNGISTIFSKGNIPQRNPSNEKPKLNNFCYIGKKSA